MYPYITYPYNINLYNINPYWLYIDGYIDIIIIMWSWMVSRLTWAQLSCVSHWPISPLQKMQKRPVKLLLAKLDMYMNMQMLNLMTVRLIQLISINIYTIIQYTCMIWYLLRYYIYVYIYIYIYIDITYTYIYIYIYWPYIASNIICPHLPLEDPHGSTRHWSVGHCSFQSPIHILNNKSTIYSILLY